MASNDGRKQPERPASLKSLADHLGLSPATISVVLNDVPGRSIPQVTRDRMRPAAKKSLSTTRQPLNEPRRTAGRIAFQRIRSDKNHPPGVAVEPSLIVRESTRELQ